MPRHLVYYVACTLDSFIASIDGSFDCFLFQGEHCPDLFKDYPETFPAHIRPALGISDQARRFDTVLMGRNTYEVGLREGITNPYAPLRQYVFSRSMTSSPDPAVHLHPKDPLALVRRLKAEDGKDIWLCGGSKLASALAPEIDELILKINPVLLGSGIPLFDTLPAALSTLLLEHKVYPNGFILARYNLLH
ncbi:dihydrofolate reductase family protein [Paludibaculum fermentans]|uniref:dihydrofolate reductase family protein n=1 Tax=Paludibaculum fermentans TaxID=1473598 RepID=UPI003EBBEA11